MSSSFLTITTFGCIIFLTGMNIHNVNELAQARATIVQINADRDKFADDTLRDVEALRVQQDKLMALCADKTP